MNKENMQVQNAIIAQTVLTSNVNGTVFHFNIQGDNWNSDFSGQINDLHELSAIINTLGVNSWENLTGCPIRIMIEDNKIVNIGNFIRPQWVFNMTEAETDTDKNNV